MNQTQSTDTDTKHGHDTEDYNPTILAFVCTYCTYTAADAAGSARIQYPPNVRIIKYLCTGKIDIIHILKGFEAGADAIFVGG